MSKVEVPIPLFQPETRGFFVPSADYTHFNAGCPELGRQPPKTETFEEFELETRRRFNEGLLWYRALLGDLTEHCHLVWKVGLWFPAITDWLGMRYGLPVPVPLGEIGKCGDFYWRGDRFGHGDLSEETVEAIIDALARTAPLIHGPDWLQHWTTHAAFPNSNVVSIFEVRERLRTRFDGSPFDR